MRANAVLRGQAGVTLMEVFTTVAIIGLLSLAVLPVAGTFLTDSKAKAAAQQAAGALRQARQNALSTAATYTVLFEPTTITIACTDEVPAGNQCPTNRPPDRTEEIVANASMSASAAPFMLGPTGAATMGNVQVTYGASTWDVRINEIGGVKVCTPQCS